MDEQQTTCDYDIAIIGGGAGGVLSAIQLLRQATGAIRIVLIEAQPQLAQGVAYATQRPEHLLNVPAGRMSGFDDTPDDFLDYLRQQTCAALPSGDALAGSYVSRLHYAGYLRQRLQQARAHSKAQLDVLNQRVEALDKSVHRITLHLQQGSTLQVRALLLAVGQTPRPLPLRDAAPSLQRLAIDAWESEAVANLATTASVCIIGSGLSMADSVLSLCANGHRGQLHVVSRHGLMPLPHAAGAAADYDIQALHEMNLRQRLRTLRQHAREAAARGIPWQSVMERIRPYGQTLWQSLSQSDQRRFLRHVVRYWDVHRHRIAAEVHAQLQAMRERGQLQVHRARLETAAWVNEGVQVTARSHHGTEVKLQVQHLLNATGVEMRVQKMRNPLLQQLLKQGHAATGPHGIGIDTDIDGRLLDATGQADSRIHVIGSLRIGRLWESLAIPELRGQARAVASALLAVAAR